MNESQQAKVSVFKLIKQNSGVAHVIIDDTSATVNTLKNTIIDEFSLLLKTIKEDGSLKGLIIYSGKPDCFIAGADIHMLAECDTRDEVMALSRQGQMLFDKLNQLAIPVVAAINGSCLGGGLELALACHYRVCSSSEKTRLGLPEVQLGLLPGSGGTQRLPKLIGVQKALDLMLTGKQVGAKQALKMGLVDDVLAPEVMIEEVEQWLMAGKFKKRQRVKTWLELLLTNNSLGRMILFNQAEKSVLKKTQGNYPAPLKIIDCVQMGIEQSTAKGYQLEAELFSDLVLSKESAQLRALFFATTAMKKEQGSSVKPEPVNYITVLGSGLMGGGISYVSAIKAGITVRIKDISPKGISAALAYSYRLLSKKQARGFISEQQVKRAMATITGSVDYSGIKNTDVVIEAVFEDLTLKQQMLADIERICDEQTIFASNTSSLPIHQIAEKAARPEQVIGLHYFSPVDKMPLVEVIPHNKTSEKTISTVVALAKKQGKTPIVVKDSAGFYVNRILAPYMNEAAHLLISGVSIEKIDQAFVKFGFPVGPLKLLDEVGIDIGAKIGPILANELGERFESPPVFEKLLSDGRLGKKASKGFYLYSNNRKSGTIVDDSIYRLLNIEKSTLIPDKLVEQCLYLMLNEAAYCLAQGVIRSPRDGDIGAIFGIGFPPFLGGPFRYIDSIGAANLVRDLNQWSNELGQRFQPCQALVEMAEQGLTYY